ncbi:hypothetical protein ACIQUF_25145 [Pseudomonas sp. NPDC090233]|uniref:hypothetical protein n=1 Tax=Pseudomonas sp. NPDC090233 TaxID=3364479 RepID=UPI00383BE146
MTNPSDPDHDSTPLAPSASGLPGPAENLFLLINPMGDCKEDHPLSMASLTEALGSEAIIRVTRDDLAFPHFWPALVQFPADDATAADLLRLSQAYASREMAARTHYVCGWLSSEQPGAIIGQHITLLCQALRPADKATAVPWFEPVRVALLRAAMKDAGKLLGPIRSWFHPGVDGGIAQFKGSPSTSELGVPEVARQVQQLAPHVSHFLAAWRELNRSAKAYAPWRWSGPTGLPDEAPTHAWNLIRDAHQYGLRDYADIHCLNLHRVMLHPLLLRHPEIQKDVAQAVAGNQGLTARFAAYDDPAWSRIVAELPQARSYS